MTEATVLEGAPDPTGKWLYRVGGISALVLGLAYIVTIPIYVAAGIPPSGAEG